MNPREAGPGHWVCTTLPDGRYVMAPHDDPVVPAIRASRDGDAEALATVTAWMNAREPLERAPLRLIQGELFTAAEIPSPLAADLSRTPKESAA